MLAAAQIQPPKDYTGQEVIGPDGKERPSVAQHACGGCDECEY